MDPTEELVRREVDKARKIIQEDRHHTELKGLRERFDKRYPETEPDDSGPPKAPPAKDPVDPAPEKRPGIWWGGTQDE